MVFLAIGSDGDGWRVEAGGAVHTGAITGTRTDDNGHPIVVKVGSLWIPWATITSLENISEKNRRRT